MGKDIIITQADIQQLAKDEHDALAAIADLQAKVAIIRKKREFAELWGADIHSVAPNGSSTKPSALSPKTEKFSEALERIATTNSAPISKTDLKKRLSEIGHDKQNSPQFYTTLKRLKDKGRVSVLPDGRVWRPGA